MTKRITTFFTDSGTPKTGLSATIRIRNSAGTLVVTNAAMTELGDGFYHYDFTTYDEEEDYTIRCDGSATLTNALDRYTYAGNESYQEDILDATASDHQTAGTIGAELMSGGGVILGNHNGGAHSGFFKEDLEAIAREVWQFILDNNKSAKDVLISRSDFNAIRDKVLISEHGIPDRLNFANEFVILRASVNEIVDKMAVMCEKDAPPVAIPEGLVSSINAVISKADKMMSGVEKIVPAVTKNAEVLKTSVDDLSDKVFDLQDQLAGTNLDLSKAQDLATALTVVKDFMMTLLSMSVVDRAMPNGAQRDALRKQMIAFKNLKFSSLIPTP